MAGVVTADEEQPNAAAETPETPGTPDAAPTSRTEVVASGPVHHPQADRAYVLGLLSVVGAVFVLPVLVGPYAWYLGWSTRREIEREPDRWSGRRQATAGTVLGVVATLLLAALVLAAIGFATHAWLRLSADTGY